MPVVPIKPVKITTNKMGFPTSITYGDLDLHNLIPIIEFSVDNRLGETMRLTLTIDAPVVIEQVA